jgi:predicted helicase
MQKLLRVELKMRNIGFDNRYVYYSRILLDRPVYKIMQHMLIEENLGLITARSNKSSDMDHFFITSSIMETKCGESTTQSNIFPLYLKDKCEDISKNGLQQNIEDNVFRLSGGKGLSINYNYNFIKKIENKLGLKFVCKEYGDLKTNFGAEDLLFYIYAIFYSPTYRIRYFEFLKDDYPRIPITSNTDLFRILSNYGKKLANLHLLNFPIHENKISYPIQGTDMVKNRYPKYIPINDRIGKIYINDVQYYDSVPFEVWAFRVGGYQVCYNWLKARRNLKLTIDDLRRFEQILIAVDKTLEIMEKIDDAIQEWPIE